MSGVQQAVALWILDARLELLQRLKGRVLCKWHQDPHGWRALVDGISEEQAERLRLSGEAARIEHASDGWYPDKRGGAYLVRDGSWQYLAPVDIRPKPLDSGAPFRQIREE